MTEISFWTNTLTQAEINELYNDGKAGYWRNNGLNTWKNLILISTTRLLNEALTDSETDVNIDADHGFIVNDVMVVGDEEMLITAIPSTNTMTVTRGYNNTVATAHDDDSPISIYKNGTVNNITETLLIPAGVDGSRDSQGFIMNKPRNTSSLNLPIGTDDYVHVPTRTDGGDDDLAFIGVGDGFSVSCWVKKNNVSSGEWVINRNDATDGWRLGFDGDEKLKFQIEENTNIVAAITDSALSLNTWYHVVGTFDGDPSNDGSGVVKLYLNGVNGGATTNDATSADMDASAANSIPLTIGSGHLGYFEGEIDGVLIYNDVLTQDEVTRIYNATKGSHRN